METESRSSDSQRIGVRAAVRADEDAILALARRFSETRPAWRSAEEVDEGEMRVLRRVLAQPASHEAIFVAERDGVEGFVYVYAEPDFFTGEPHAHISEIAVARDGSGAGRALMAMAERWATDRGHRYVSLHVNAANERAARFYATLGYDLEWQRLNKRLSDVT